MNKRALFGLSTLLIVGIIVVQFTMIGSMRSELSQLRAELASLTGTPSQPEPERDRADNSPAPRLVASSGNLNSRLARLEQSVADLVEATETLRERGTLPLNANNLQDYKNRFADPTASENDRMRALRMLRRNRAISDDVVLSAVDFLRTSTNANVRRELVQNLDSSTNAAIKQPLMSLLSTETSSRVREELVDTLGDFARTDPAVADKLWEIAQNDPDPEVREEALQEVARGNLDESRVATLRQQAISPDASLDDRLRAFQALRQADVATPDVTATMVQLAQAAEDPTVRARIFGAFDGVSDEALKAPLFYALQDPNPVVREQAADALGQFASSDPQVQEWLKYLADNDPDPRVQREAHRQAERSNQQARPQEWEGGGRDFGRRGGR